jgi:hypothetical protein
MLSVQEELLPRSGGFSGTTYSTLLQCVSNLRLMSKFMTISAILFIIYSYTVLAVGCVVRLFMGWFMFLDVSIAFRSNSIVLIASVIALPLLVGVGVAVPAFC